MKNLSSFQKKVFFPLIFLLISILSPVAGFGKTINAPVPPPPPSNDDCSGAIFITPTTTGIYTTYSNSAATPSVGVPAIPAPGCANYIDGDVWFAVIVPLSGHLIFDALAGTMTDGGMAIYSGGCSGLTLLACNDDKAPPGNKMPQIDKLGLPIYVTVYIRFWGKGANNFGTFQLAVVYSPPQPPCFNLGFENDYSGWFATLGQQYDGGAGAGTPVYYPISFNNTANSNFSIANLASGNDPNGGFPQVYSGTKSLKIGNIGTYETYDGASVEQSFTVGTNTNFIYHYAVVLQTGGHPYNQQPFFQIDLFDQYGAPINCAIYSVALPSAVFTQVGSSSTYYKPWTTISVNLSAYINQTVTIKFTISDCSPGAHWGYAYLDCTCQPFDIQTSNDTICAGFNDTLSAPPGALSYLWNTTPAQTTPTIIVNPTTTTTYSCVVTTQGNTPCPSTLTKKIVIDPGFTSSISNNSPICPGDTLKLTCTPPGLTSYRWTGPNGFVDSTQNTFIANVTPANVGNYSVTIKNSRGCSSLLTTPVTLYPLPTIVTTDGSACIGDTATISATGGTNYLWSNGDTTSTTSIAPLATTTYQVKVTDLHGCKDTSSATAVINPLPVIQLSGNTSICLGESSTLTASGGTSYLWDSTLTTAAITVNPTSLTTYHVSVTDGNGCTDTSSISVDVFPLPVPLITQETDTICKGAYTTITASGGTIYNWSSGENTAAIYVRPLLKTVYTVTVSENHNNITCSDVASTVMNVRNCNVIYVPNSFSPAGFNTVFKPIGDIVISKTYQLKIYNRWGQMLFETTNINQGWDGRFNGEYVPSGVYIYYINIDNGYEDPYEKIGTVTVIE
jgi:gliding motility-associated-like protein